MDEIRNKRRLEEIVPSRLSGTYLHGHIPGHRTAHGPVDGHQAFR